MLFSVFKVHIIDYFSAVTRYDISSLAILFIRLILTFFSSLLKCLFCKHFPSILYRENSFPARSTDVGDLSRLLCRVSSVRM